MDVNNMLAVDEYPLGDLIEIASLKKLAVTRLAADLWCLNVPKMKFSDLFGMRYEYENNLSCEEIMQVKLPPCIRDLIDKRIRLWGKELKNLYNSTWFRLSTSSLILTCFDSFTHGPDGQLCAERSAKNLLTSRKLNISQKFEIACVHGFEDEIRRIWHSMSDHSVLDGESGRFSIYSEIFVQSWCINMELCFIDHYKNICASIVLNCFVCFFQYSYNWSGYVYCLNTQKLEKQYHFLSKLSSHCNNVGIKYLLPKLNEAQLNYLLSLYPNQIIKALAFDHDSFEYVPRIWKIVREFIDGESFSNILYSLCSKEYYWQTGNKEKPTYLQEILLEIWITAPNRLKNEFFGGHYMEKVFPDFIDIGFTFPKVCYFYNHIDERFISNMFSDMPLEMRTEIWHSHWPGVVIHSSAKFQNQLLKMCVGENDDVIKQFVEEEMLNFTRVEPIIQSWWAMELYERIINYSKLCSWNNQLAREFRNKIFSWSIPSSLNIFNYDKLIKLELAIDNCLTNAEEAKDVKKTIFFSKSVENILRLKLRVGLAKDVVSVVDRFLPTERSLHEKQFFLNQWSKFLTFDRNRKFDDSCWEEFLSWWLNNEDDLPIFKKFLPVDRNLEKLLLEAVEKLSLRLGPLEKKRIEHVSSINCKIEEFTRVDNFLNWYFGDEAAVRDYKRSKMMNYRQTTVIKNLLLSRKHECIFDYILVWFFNGDVTRIRNFRRKYNRKKHVV